MQIERRTATVHALKVEQRANTRPLLRGHAAVFGQLSEDLGGFREVIEAGAFREAVRLDDVRALFNHDANLVLGRNRAKTLRLSEDSQGLAIEIDLPDTSCASDLYKLIQRGDVSQMSFGFTLRPNGDAWSKDASGQYIRTLRNLRLFDVSPVTFPAYPQTDVSVALRSLHAFQQRHGGGSTHWRLTLMRRRLDLECDARRA